MNSDRKKVWPIKVLNMYLRLPAFYAVDQHWITEGRIPSHFHLPFSHSLNLFLAWSIFKKTGCNAHKAQSTAFEKKNLHPAKTLQSDIELFLSLGSLKSTHAHDCKDRLTKHLLIEKSQPRQHFKHENYFLHYPVHISCGCYYSVSLHLFYYLFIQHNLTGVSMFIFLLVWRSQHIPSLWKVCVTVKNNNFERLCTVSYFGVSYCQSKQY